MKYKQVDERVRSLWGTIINAVDKGDHTTADRARRLLNQLSPKVLPVKVVKGTVVPVKPTKQEPE